MKTPIELIYDQYEKFRGSKTKEEHADKFLAWFLTYKEQNLGKEKQAIIEAYVNGSYRYIEKATNDAKQYYTETFKK